MSSVLTTRIVPGDDWHELVTQFSPNGRLRNLTPIPAYLIMTSPRNHRLLGKALITET
jgi:hypothetical protein